jgi:hypothetical protein
MYKARCEYSSLYILISALYVSAKKLMLISKEYVFSMLQKSEKENNIFLRLMLRLLKEYPDSNRDLIEKYLTNIEYFDSNLLSDAQYHEYWLLLQQEFKNLSKKGRNLIFSYIDALRYGRKSYVLEAIKDNLSNNEKDRYKDILYKNSEISYDKVSEQFVSLFDDITSTLNTKRTPQPMRQGSDTVKY